MNLGQMQLRIWQLEDELEARGGQRSPKPAPALSLAVPEAAPVAAGEPEVSPPGGRLKRRRRSRNGIGKLVHAAVPIGPPGLTLAEIRARLDPAVPRGSVSGFLAFLDDIVREGEPRRFRYYRKAAA